MYKLIEKLSNAYGPSGREEEVRRIIIDELSDFYSDIKIDNLGNLIIHKPGKMKKIGITAPMDEVGFVITHNYSENNINCASIGYVNANTLQNILLYDNNNNIYITDKITEKDDKIGKISSLKLNLISMCKVNTLNTDIISNTAVYNKNINKFNENIVGKALERSVCCAILCDIARKMTDSLYEYYFVFSTYNYCDKKGANVALCNCEIDELYCISMIDEEEVSFDNSKDYAIILRDKLLISSNKMSDKLSDKNECKIVSKQLLTDAGIYQNNPLIKDVISMAIPVKYLYSPNELVNIKKIDSFIKVLEHIILP